MKREGLKRNDSAQKACRSALWLCHPLTVGLSNCHIQLSVLCASHCVVLTMMGRSAFAWPRCGEGDFSSVISQQMTQSGIWTLLVGRFLAESWTELSVRNTLVGVQSCPRGDWRSGCFGGLFQQLKRWANPQHGVQAHTRAHPPPKNCRDKIKPGHGRRFSNKFFLWETAGPSVPFMEICMDLPSSTDKHTNIFVPSLWRRTEKTPTVSVYCRSYFITY